MEWLQTLLISFHDFKAEILAGYYSTWMLITMGLFTLIIVICIGALIFHYVIRPKLDEISLQKIRSAPVKSKSKQKKFSSKITEAEFNAPSVITKELKMKKNSMVTEKTREQIAQVVDSVKTFSFDGRTRVAPSPEGRAQIEKKLDDSELILGLAQTLISEPVIDQTSDGKFTKMTIDGALLFEDEMIDSNSP